MGLLNDEQKNAIIDILKEQCLCIQKANALERDMFPNLYDAQYMSGRHHSNTAKVYLDSRHDDKKDQLWCPKVAARDFK